VLQYFIAIYLNPTNYGQKTATNDVITDAIPNTVNK